MFITRRNFVKTSFSASTLLAFSSLVPGFLCRSAAAPEVRRGGKGTALVVVQLSGGNDGLNTVVPYEDDAYHRNRPTLRIAGNKVLKIGQRLGFHPDMSAFHKLFNEGLLSVVQGTGYPASSRNHDGAMHDWHTALPKEVLLQTGWIGRALEQVYDPQTQDVPGVFVGHIHPPFSLRTEKVIVPVVRDAEQWSTSPGSNNAGKQVYRQQMLQAIKANPGTGDNPLLEFVKTTSQQTLAASQRVETHSLEMGSGAAYPQFRLAQTLRTIAQMIRSDLGIRIYFVELGGGNIGGFDTHAGQAANHGALLRELAEAVSAFMGDLQRDKLHQQVMLMTFSEFGRTLAENGRRGTGHGTSAPMFLAGGALKGGIVGAHPSLTNLDGDAPRFHTDFRRVYATVLERWLGIESTKVLGGRFAPVEGIV
jgi:uncharacterized protein (DUF1501 family)